VTVDIRVGDCLEVLRTLDSESVQCVVTSPPYFGLRDYGVAGQIGLEATPDAYVAKMVAVFGEVRRVLRDEGTLWLNLGDSYTTGASTAPRSSDPKAVADLSGGVRRIGTPAGLKAKDLIGIPWKVAFALQADGWYLRSDIIWHKPNPMPESVTDRPTKAHEYLFLLAKNERYFYDADAIAEPSGGWNGSRFDDGKNEQVHPNVGRNRSGNKERKYGDDRDRPGSHLGASIPWEGDTRNKRTVWSVNATGNRERECMVILESNLNTVEKWEAIKSMMSGAQSDVWRVATQPFSGAHFATFPPALIKPCILAGSRRGDTVLDPFGGAGTTGLVADRLSRNALLIELNPDYAALARRRITDDAPLFADGAA
jgi:DNA modification methylase